MNCVDMTEIPELKKILKLRSGEKGMWHTVRWIYFADCLQCVRTEYKMGAYIHGGEFVILTNRDVTDDNDKLLPLIDRMREYDIAALGINEGQISDRLIEYCDANELPLFEIPEKYALIDLSQILCKELVKEEMSNNSAERLFAAILDAEHIDKSNILKQAAMLDIDLSGKFAVAEVSYRIDNGILESEKKINSIVNEKLKEKFGNKMLILPQAGCILVMFSTEDTEKREISSVFENIADLITKECQVRPIIGVGRESEYLEDIFSSRNEAAEAIRFAGYEDTQAVVNFYDDKGTYALISKVSDGKFLDDYVEWNLGKLIRADGYQEGGGVLCETLEKYIECNCNLKKTAEELYIHRNTMNYRIKKISDILEEDLDDFEVCMRLKMAFKVRKYRKRHIVVHRAQ